MFSHVSDIYIFFEAPIFLLYPSFSISRISRFSDLTHILFSDMTRRKTSQSTTMPQTQQIYEPVSIADPNEMVSPPAAVSEQEAVEAKQDNPTVNGPQELNEASDIEDAVLVDKVDESALDATIASSDASAPSTPTDQDNTDEGPQVATSELLTNNGTMEAIHAEDRDLEAGSTTPAQNKSSLLQVSPSPFPQTHQSQAQPTNPPPQSTGSPLPPPSSLPLLHRRLGLYHPHPVD
jgi:hypothetical protein